jgi:hypothetical protein
MIGGIVMPDVAEQQAGFSPVNDQSNVTAYPNRPKSAIFRSFELVELHARMRRVQLKIERRRLYGLLLIAGEFGQAIRKSVGNPEFH